MNRIPDRYLPPGRGRVWPAAGVWFANYRSSAGTQYGSWAESVGECHDWIRERAASCDS